MSSVLPLLECESAQASTEHGLPDKSADICSITKIKDPNSQNPKMSRSVIGDIYIENGGKITLQLHLQAYEFEALRRSFEEGVEVQERAEDFEKRNEELRMEIEEEAENQRVTDDLRTRNNELRRKVEDGVEYQKKVEDLERRTEEFRIKTENESEYHKTTENLHERNGELRGEVEDGLEHQKEVEDLEKRNEELRRKIEEGAEYQKAAEDLHTRNEELRRRVEDSLEGQKKVEDLEKRNQELQRKIEEGAKYQKAAEDLHTQNEELRRQVEEGSEYQKEVEDLKKRNEELQKKIEEGAKYQKAAEDLHTRNEELQRSNKELQNSVVDLEAKLAECDTKNQNAEAEICAYKSRVVDLEAKLVEFGAKTQKADAEICAYKTKTAYLEWDVQGLRKDIFSLLPFEQVTGTEILRRFDSICDSISSWIGKQLPRNSSEPRFLDGGNQHFAYFLKDNDRAGQFIIQSLIHQCLQKEFFGEHVYLVGIPEEHAGLLQVIQTSMATRKPFPAQPRGARNINNWRSETLKALATLPEVVKWRDELAHAAAERIFGVIRPFFPVAAKRRESCEELYEKIVKPSVQLALDIQTTSIPYTFMPPMDEPEQLYGFERVGMDIVDSITAMDFKSHKTLKSTSSVRKDSEGFIGKPILLVEPALLLKEYGDNDVVWSRPLRHATYLLELFYPLEENELDRQNHKVQQLSKPPPWLVTLIKGSSQEEASGEVMVRNFLQNGSLPGTKLGRNGLVNQRLIT